MKFCLYKRSETVTEMKSKRENDDLVEEEGFASELKRRKVVEESSPSSPPLPIANPLVGLANYDDDDEEEEDERHRRSEQNGDRKEGGQQDDDDDDDDHHEQAYSQGKRSREVERRRDCPYLDTVNRQVYNSSLDAKNILTTLLVYFCVSSACVYVIALLDT